MRLTMVAGFAFMDNRVLLCCKQKPDWQTGLWNGVGGKLDHEEAPIDGMVREFKEETGHVVASWDLFCTELGPDYVVHFFRATLPDGGTFSKWPLRNDVGEPLSWAPLRDVPLMPCIGNCYWLIPLARDWRRTNRQMIFDTQEDIREKATW